MSNKIGRPSGYKMSDESKQKTSDSLIGRKRSPEERDAISRGRKKAYDDEYKHYQDLLDEYNDNKEIQQWLKQHKDELKSDNFGDVLTGKEMSNNKIPSVSYDDNACGHDLTPEKLVILKESLIDE